MLAEIGVAREEGARIIEAWNKIDALGADEGESWSLVAAHLPDVLCVRAAAV